MYTTKTLTKKSEYTITTCLHPTYIIRDGVRVCVPCGHCAACISAKAAKFQNVVEMQGSNTYNTFVFLSYSNKYVPLCDVIKDDLDDEYYVRHRKAWRPYRLKKYSSIYVNDNFFYEEKREIPKQCYQIERFGSKGIAVLSRYDFKNFLKRVREGLSRAGLNSQNLQYSGIGEYGPTTFRPHYHIFFTSRDPRIIAFIQDNLSTLWKLGASDSGPSRGFTAKYISQYISCLSHLPNFLQHPSLKPFVSHSNAIAKGYCSEMFANNEVLEFEKCREMLSSSCELHARNSFNSSYIHTIYPRCFCFDVFNDSDVIKVYSIYPLVRNWYSRDVPLTKIAEDLVRSYCLNIYLSHEITYFMECMQCPKFGDVPSNSPFFTDYLKPYFSRVYNTLLASRAVYRQSRLIGCSIEDYCISMMRFYVEYDQYKLQKFIHNIFDYVKTPKSASDVVDVCIDPTILRLQGSEYQQNAVHYQALHDKSYKKCKTTDMLWRNKQRYGKNFKNYNY